MKQRDRSTWNCRRVQILNDEGYEVTEVMQDTRIDTTPDVCYRWNRPEIHPHWRGYDVEEWQELTQAALTITQGWLSDVGNKATEQEVTG